MSARYRFECDIQGADLELYFEDEAVAIDMQPNDKHRMYGAVPRIERPVGFEVIVPVAEVENLISALQGMVQNIRERFPDAA